MKTASSYDRHSATGLGAVKEYVELSMLDHIAADALLRRRIGRHDGTYKSKLL